MARPGGHGRGLVVACLSGLALVAPAVAGEEPKSVLVEGGTFLMGTAPEAIEGLKVRYDVRRQRVFENEVPSRLVTVSDFRLDRHEVTNARFAVFLEENPAWQRERLPTKRHNGDYLRGWSGAVFPPERGEHPVVDVTWHAAQAFCGWLGGRLPTEAEWEYAARCGDDREFPWGDELPSPTRVNYSASGHRATVAAGSYPPNDCGLQDLAGSVWEFLLDAWEPVYREEEKTDPCVDCPMTAEEAMLVEGRRAVRGGSFDGAVVNLRTRWRDSHVVTNAIGFVGFRCAYPAGATLTTN